jgi:hypothetical protein
MPGNDRRSERRPGATETFGGVRASIPRTIDITFDPRGVWAEVGPYKARGLLVSVGVKAPVWLPRLKAWSCSYQHGRDVLALAQRFGCQVTVHEAEAVPVEIVLTPRSQADRDVHRGVDDQLHLLDDDRHLW